jgi:hypothetical protein
MADRLVGNGRSTPGANDNEIVFLHDFTSLEPTMREPYGDKLTGSWYPA